MESNTPAVQPINDQVLHELVELLLGQGRINGIYGLSLGLKHGDRLFIHKSTLMQVLGERVERRFNVTLSIDALMEALSSAGWLEQQWKDERLIPAKSFFTVQWNDTEQLGYRDFRGNLVSNKWNWMILLKWQEMSATFGQIPNGFLFPTGIWPSFEKKRRSNSHLVNAFHPGPIFPDDEEGT